MALPQDSTLTLAKYNAFWGTIALCIIYAVIALILLLVGAFTEFGKTVIFGDLKTFTQTYIFGTIVIIIVIAVYVNDWNGKNTATNSASTATVVDTISCPDYWKMDKLTSTDISNMRNSLTSSANLLNTTTTVNGVTTTTETPFKTDYYNKNFSDGVLHNVCKMDPVVFDATKHQYPSVQNDVTGILNDNFSYRFNDPVLRNNMYLMSADTSGSPLVKETTDANGNKTYSAEIKCNQVFPELLAKVDADAFAANNYKGPSNTYRCEFAKACGVPWTDAGCSAK